MRVLVTGAGGFIGRVATRRLAEAGLRVTALTRRPAEAGWDPSVAVAAGDLASPDTVLPPVDAVLHAAATSPAPGIDADRFLDDNVLATRRLADHAVACGARMVFLSSVSVHGRVEAPVVDEATPIRDPEPYGLSKRLCEMLLEARASRGLSAVSLRLPGVVGPGCRSPWLRRVLDQLRAGATVTVANPQAPFNNAVLAGDLAEFCLSLLLRPWSGWDMLTLGAAGSLTIAQVVETLAEAAGRPARWQAGPPGPSFTISSVRAAERHGYRPRDIGDLLQRFAKEAT